MLTLNSASNESNNFQQIDLIRIHHCSEFIQAMFSRCAPREILTDGHIRNFASHLTACFKEDIFLKKVGVERLAKSMGREVPVTSRCF